MIVIIILSILFIISLVWYIIIDVVVCNLDFDWKIGLPCKR